MGVSATELVCGTLTQQGGTPKETELSQGWRICGSFLMVMGSEGLLHLSGSSTHAKNDGLRWVE